MACYTIFKGKKLHREWKHSSRQLRKREYLGPRHRIFPSPRETRKEPVGIRILHTTALGGSSSRFVAVGGLSARFVAETPDWPRWFGWEAFHES
eukprot:1160296-Pelagomonas_calceolata.AAC.4